MLNFCLWSADALLDQVCFDECPLALRELVEALDRHDDLSVLGQHVLGACGPQSLRDEVVQLLEVVAVFVVVHVFEHEIEEGVENEHILDVLAFLLGHEYSHVRVDDLALALPVRVVRLEE